MRFDICENCEKNRFTQEQIMNIREEICLVVTQEQTPNIAYTKLSRLMCSYCRNFAELVTSYDGNTDTVTVSCKNKTKGTTNELQR